MEQGDSIYGEDQSTLTLGRGCFRFLLGFFLLIVGILVFWPDIGYLFQKLPEILAAPPVDLIFHFPGQAYFAFIFAYLTLLIGWFGILLFSIAQSILPLDSWDQTWVVFRHLVWFLSGMGTSTARVVEGRLMRFSRHEKEEPPDILLVDAESAVVMERQLTPFRATFAPATPGGVQVSGPGVSISLFRNKILGTVSLRKQFRSVLDVHAYTSDSIEVKANAVFILFTVGQAPRVLKVFYNKKPGDPFRAEDLRTVRMDEHGLITSIEDDLDLADKQEIHAHYLTRWVYQMPCEKLAPDEPANAEVPPYHYDPDHVTRAVYSQAYNLQSEQQEDWCALPGRVAREVFRNLVSEYTYDTLTLTNRLKPRFDTALRNRGVLSYQLLVPLAGSSIKKGMKVSAHTCRFYPVQALENGKILRSRGIKVIYAGFSELRPTNPAILQQRFDNWRAAWEKKTMYAQADHDLEVMRIFNHTRAQTQRDVIMTLSDLFNDQQVTSEAMAILLYQTLERLASDPSTRQLLPYEVMSELRDFNSWLKPKP